MQWRSWYDFGGLGYAGSWYQATQYVEFGQVTYIFSRSRSGPAHLDPSPSFHQNLREMAMSSLRPLLLPRCSTVGLQGVVLIHCQECRTKNLRTAPTAWERVEPTLPHVLPTRERLEQIRRMMRCGY